MSTAKHIINFVLNEAEEDFEMKDLTSGDFPAPPTDPYETWLETYKPIKNDVVDGGGDAPFEGTMFEVYGREFARVRSAPNEHVWTLVTGDNNEDVVCAGRHFVNRMGYFITERPWETGVESFVVNEGDPTGAEGAADDFINNVLGREWVSEWEGLPPEERLAKVSAHAEEFGLEGTANEIVAEVDKAVATLKARQRGGQI